MAEAPESFAEEKQLINARWERLRTVTLVEQAWPSPGGIPAREALLRWAPEVHEKLATKHALIHRFGVIPIAAVVGLLNSGKSSLTASFLSEENRSRVLRGLGQGEGSHRFTVWIPHAWKRDPALFEDLLQFLARAFASEPEWLAPDTETARRQQNDFAKLEQPLIATDAALTEHRLAILDCPDVERAERLESDTRLQMVKRAAELCAAVFVVFARSQVEIRALHALLDAMPGAQRILAINLIKHDPAELVRQEAASVLNLRPGEPLYGAYDFLAADYEERTPRWDPNLPRSREDRLRASEPCFFALHADPVENAPGAIARERSLRALAHRFTPQAVKSRRMKELTGEFYQGLQGGIDEVEGQLDRSAGTLAEASAKLRQGCREILTKGGHLQLKMSPEIVHSIEQSLARTASSYYKWILLPQRKFFLACGRLIEKGRNFSPIPGRELRRKKASLQAKWRVHGQGKISRGSVTPEDVQRMLSLWSGATGDYRAAGAWESEATLILQRFIAEDRTNLTDAEWDALTGPLWAQLPRRARLQLFTSAFLMLGGLLLAFVDGGVSLVSLKAMDLLGGLSVAASLGVNLQGAKDFERVLEGKLGLQQVANLYAIVCDVVGLPRDADSWETFPPPTVATKLNLPNYGVHHRGWSVHRLKGETLKEIRSYGG